MVRTLSHAARTILALIRRILRYVFGGTTVLLITFLLALNVASLTISSLNSALSSLIENVSGLDTVRTKSKADLDLERGKTQHYAKKAETLELENRRLRVDGPDVEFRGKTRPMRSVVEETTSRIERRTAKVAATNIGSMAGEGIPFWGIAVIVAATSYEVATACDTMKDMHELTVALSPTTADDKEMRRICGMQVPTREEVWTTIKASPVVAWESVKKTFDNLPSPDFSGAWIWLVGQFSWN